MVTRRLVVVMVLGIIIGMGATGMAINMLIAHLLRDLDP